MALGDILLDSGRLYIFKVRAGLKVEKSILIFFIGVLLFVPLSLPFEWEPLNYFLDELCDILCLFYDRLPMFYDVIGLFFLALTCLFRYTFWLFIGIFFALLSRTCVDGEISPAWLLIVLSKNLFMTFLTLQMLSTELSYYIRIGCCFDGDVLYIYRPDMLRAWGGYVCMYDGWVDINLLGESWLDMEVCMSLRYILFYRIWEFGRFISEPPIKFIPPTVST